MKYDKSEVFKLMWRNIKKLKMNKSAGLKVAWKIIKNKVCKSNFKRMINIKIPRTEITFKQAVELLKKEYPDSYRMLKVY